jgi:hypothetical protein
VIDLKRLVNGRYRIEYDPSADIDTDRETRLWCARVPCKFGFISVHSSTMLAAYTANPRMVSKLAELEGAKIHQRGDSEIRVVFDRVHLDAVCRLLKARRRRQVSPAERDRLAALSEKYRPRPHTEAPESSGTHPRQTTE